MKACTCTTDSWANGDSLLMWTHDISNQPTIHIHTCMPTCTHSSFSLLAPQAVSHPSIHVTKRWVHPVTGQLVAVRLIYVAPLSSLFLLWWRDYVCSLPIRKVYSAHNGGTGKGAQSVGERRRARAWAFRMMASCLGSIVSYLFTAFARLSLLQPEYPLYRPIVPLLVIHVAKHIQRLGSMDQKHIPVYWTAKPDIHLRIYSMKRAKWLILSQSHLCDVTVPVKTWFLLLFKKNYRSVIWINSNITKYLTKLVYQPCDNIVGMTFGAFTKHSHSEIFDKSVMLI